MEPRRVGVFDQVQYNRAVQPQKIASACTIIIVAKTNALIFCAVMERRREKTCIRGLRPGLIQSTATEDN